MSSLTTNLKLVKPELQDNITPTIFADNFDKIDAALEGVSGGALSLEEIEASTNLDGKIPSAAALKEVNNSLGGFTPIIDDTGKITGYKTKVGADTVFPFSRVVASGNIYKTLASGQTYEPTIAFGKEITNPKVTIEILSYSTSLYCGIINITNNDALLKILNASGSRSQTFNANWYVYDGDIS